MAKDRSETGKIKTDYLSVGASSGSIALALKISSVALLFFNQIALARILGTDGIGQVLLALNVVFILSQIAKFGMEDAMMRFIPMYVEQGDKARLKGTIYFALKCCFFISIIFILVVILLSKFISINIFHSEGLAMLLPIVTIAILTNAMRGVIGGILKGYRETFKAVFPEFCVSPFLRLVIFLLLCIKGGTPLFAIYSFVTGEIIATLLSGAFLLKRVKRIKSEEGKIEYKKIIDVAFSMVFAGGLTIILFTQADLWIVGMFQATSSVGIYGVVTKLVMLIILPLGTLSAIIPPLIASIYTSGDIAELKSLISESSRWILSLSMPIILILLLEGDVILQLVFGEKFVSGYTALLILALGQLINASTGLVGYLLQMTGGHRIIMKINLFWGILNVILNIILVPRFGIVGAAISTAFCLAMGNITAVIVTYKRLSVLTLAKGIKFDIIFTVVIAILYFISQYNNFHSGNHVLLFCALLIYIWKAMANHDLPWRLLIDRFKAT